MTQPTSFSSFTNKPERDAEAYKNITRSLRNYFLIKIGVTVAIIVISRAVGKKFEKNVAEEN